MTDSYCNCIEEVNETLLLRNERLVLGVSLNGQESYPLIMSELIVSKKGQRKRPIIPSFCPFCGRSLR